MEQTKNIAVLTGATGGLGYAFLKELQKENIDEIWAVGRNKDRLEKLSAEFGSRLVPMCLDLTVTEDVHALSEALKRETPQIKAAAFQPTPYINLYASTKAFLRSYSRAMNVELKPAGITVTAVCPGWIDTDFLIKVINGKKVKFGGLVLPEKVAKKALRDAKKGKDMSVCTLYVKLMHTNVKFLPQKLTMKIWTGSVKKYF